MRRAVKIEIIPIGLHCVILLHLQLNYCPAEFGFMTLLEFFFTFESMYLVL